MAAASHDLPVPRRLGDFDILRELGRGGMGVVYEALQCSLQRRVALKVLSSSLGLTPLAVLRFKREAEAAARLHHSNIVPVHATGEEGGAHFYAMELVEGPSLDQVIRQLRTGRTTTPAPTGRDAETVASGPRDETPVPSGGSARTRASSSFGSAGPYYDAVARALAEVADALHYAHQRGVIHRDLKPANLLVEGGEWRVEGDQTLHPPPSTLHLMITDFGLARVLEQPGVTTTGEFVGTPAYMSPEQVTAGRIPLDHRTDIYSFGATLYELLTLQRPHQGQTREQLLAQIVHKEPRAPRRLQPKVPVDLETICLKCLEKDPDRRYQTAGQIADDLRRYLRRFPISARRAGPARRLLKWARRQPALAASLGLLLLAGLLAAGALYRAHALERDRRREQEEARLHLLDEKVRNAYLVAASGNLVRTDEVIKDLERLGASTGQVRLLRGVLAYFRGEVPAAIGELEQAAALLPESVAARALLAVAYADNAQYVASQEFLRAANDLTPHSPEDYLFKGYAQELVVPGLGLPDLDEALRRFDSPLGRALRALVRANRAMDTGAPADVEGALADVTVARAMLADNPFVLYVSVYARLVAAGLYEEAGQAERRGAALREAATDLKALEPFPELTNPAWVSWVFYEVTGDGPRALEVARRALARSGSPTHAANGAVTLYEQGRFAEALQCLDQRRERDLFGDALRIAVVAELHGPARAAEEYEKLSQEHPHKEMPEVRCFTTVLCLLGRGGEALDLLHHHHEPLEDRSPVQKDLGEGARRFDGRAASAQAYLARAGASRSNQFTAHYDIGLYRLAQGDRAGAKRHFQEAQRARIYWDQYYYLARMFLHRLESNAAWPAWIPAAR